MKTIKIIMVLTVILLISATNGFAQKRAGQTNDDFYTEQFFANVTKGSRKCLAAGLAKVDIDYLKKYGGDSLSLQKLEIQLTYYREELELIDVSLNLLYVGIDNSTIVDKEKYLKEISERRLQIAKEEKFIWE
ncbi:MAG: hypothetical protein ABH951_01235 [Patescibacteria group bacterium]